MPDLIFDHVSKRYRIRHEVESSATRHPLVRKLMKHPDAVEGPAAGRERRTPVWTARVSALAEE